MLENLERSFNEAKTIEDKKNIRDLIEILEMNSAEEVSPSEMLSILKRDINIKSSYEDPRYMYDLVSMKKNSEYTIPNSLNSNISTDVYCYGKAYVNYKKVKATKVIASEYLKNYIPYLKPERIQKIVDTMYKAELEKVEGRTSYFNVVTNTGIREKNAHVDNPKKLTRKQSSWERIESFSVTEPTMRDVRENPDEFIKGIKMFAYNVTVHSPRDLQRIISAFEKHELPIRFIIRPNDDNFEKYTLVWTFDNSFTRNRQIINDIKKRFKYLVLRIKELNNLDCFIDVTNSLSFIKMKNAVYFRTCRHLDWRNIVTNYNALVQNCNPFLYIDYVDRHGVDVSIHDDVQLYLSLGNFSAVQENVRQNKRDIRDIDKNELLYKDIYTMDSVGGDWMYNKYTTKKHYTGLDLYRTNAKDSIELTYLIENVYPYIMYKYNDYGISQIMSTLRKMIKDSKEIAADNIKGVEITTRTQHLFSKKELLDHYTLCEQDEIVENLERNKCNHKFIFALSKIKRLYNNNLLNWKKINNSTTGLTKEEVCTIVAKQKLERKTLINVKAIETLLNNNINRAQIFKLFDENEYISIEKDKAEYFVNLSDENKEYFGDLLSFDENNVIVKTCGHSTATKILRHFEGKQLNNAYVRAQQQLRTQKFNQIEFEGADEFKNIYDDIFYPLCTGKPKDNKYDNNPLINWFNKVDFIKKESLRNLDLHRMNMECLENYEKILKHFNILRQLKGYVFQNGSKFLLPGLEENSRQPISREQLDTLRKLTDESIEFFRNKIKKFEDKMYRIRNGYSTGISEEVLNKINKIINSKTISRQVNSDNGINDTSLLFYKLQDALYLINNRRLDNSTRLNALLDVLSSQKFDDAERIFEDKQLTKEYIKMLNFLKNYTQSDEASDILDLYGDKINLNNNVYVLDKAYIKKFNRDLEGSNKLNNTISKIVTKNNNFLFYNEIRRLETDFYLENYKIDLVKLMRVVDTNKVTNLNNRNLKKIEYSELMLLLKGTNEMIEFVPMMQQGGLFVPSFNIDMKFEPRVISLPFNQFIMYSCGNIYNMLQTCDKYRDKKYAEMSDVIMNFYTYVTGNKLQLNRHEVELSGILAEMFKFYDSTDVKEITNDYLLMSNGFNPMYNKQSRRKISSQDDRDSGSDLNNHIKMTLA